MTYSGSTLPKARRSIPKRPNMVMKYRRLFLLGALAVMLAGGLCAAQFRGGRGFGGGGRRAGEFLAGDEPIQPLPPDREGTPNWSLDPHF
jgi:hypothetical protein